MIKQTQRYEVAIELRIRQWFRVYCQKFIQIIEAADDKEAVLDARMLLEMARRSTPRAHSIQYSLDVKKI